jgi:hypothetical protein
MFLWKNLTLIPYNGVYIKLTSRVKKPDRYINGPDRGIQPFQLDLLHLIKLSLFIWDRYYTTLNPRQLFL